MTLKRATVTAAALITALLATTPAYASRTETTSYGPGAFLSLRDCGTVVHQGTGQPLNAGGACFALEGGESTATVTVDDAVHDAVVVRLSAAVPMEEQQPIVDGHPQRVEEIALGFYCSTDIPTVALPDGAVTFSVVLDDAIDAAVGEVFLPGPCDPSGGFATTGTVTATFD